MKLSFLTPVLHSFILFVLVSGCASGPHKKDGPSALYEDSLAIQSIIGSNSATDSIDEVRSRKAKIAWYLSSKSTLLPPDSMTPTMQKALDIAMKDTAFTQFLKYNNRPILCEVFSIFPIKPGDLTIKASPFTYKIEVYNFARNAAILAFADLEQNKLLSVRQVDQAQPDIPPSLQKIALAIATKSPEVKEALGYTPSEGNAQMASTKTSLNKTNCERSRHLCVAPTFVQGDKALWVIVDLTDLTVAGIRWTNVGTTGPAIITERKLQDDKITTCFCEQENKLRKNNWEMNYHITSSDGLEITQLSFKNVSILKSAKLVDWHVSYSTRDGFGYSDAIGCPVFSQAAVVANKAPTVAELKDEKNNIIGFTLEQTYFTQGWPTPCNYNYVQRYEFYNDGRFRVAAASIGRGCGNDGTYRPVFRIAFQEQARIQQWKDDIWETWNKEQWNLQEPTTNYTPEGYLFKIESPGYSYFIEPGRGQFNDKGRGDFAYTYATKHKAEEGDNNLITIGPCCNTDFRQGPEKFIEPTPESLENSEMVIWYVPQLRNDDRVGKEYCWAESVLQNGVFIAKTYPCMAGPLFVPGKK
jgi:hypothetical protein